MASFVVLPIHDPAGELLPHLRKVTSQMERLFDGAFLGITAATAEAQAAWIDWLESNAFFRCIVHRPGLGVGDQFRELYAGAAAAYSPEARLHLCFVDRLAFILQSSHCQQFIDDMLDAGNDESLVIFHRSEAAWATHPANYRAAERMATTAGHLLFGRTLDFAWCHLVIRAEALGALIPRSKRPDMSMVAEIVVQAMGQPIRTKDVDWLAWEDPFLMGRDACQLKREREASLQETRKRLAYVIPMLQILDAAANGAHDLP
ncbi:MAG: hypothetical protein MUC51_13350 [Anaerolineae bacterium]|jgi:hypothetical protein|nr:hypothetical protein [Anaerolineae bacterium]